MKKLLSAFCILILFYTFFASPVFAETVATDSARISPNPTISPDATTVLSTSSGSLTQNTIQTGNAVSIVTENNSLDTTTLNSDVTDQTINVFGEQIGDINLSTLFQLANTLVAYDAHTNPVDIAVTGNNTYAYLSNSVVSIANTGNNTASGNTVTISTGNAESVVSLVNAVNFTVVDSSIHLVHINIFGHLTGNIILPNVTPYQNISCPSCGISLNTQDQAVVDTSIAAAANTGQNTLTATSDATLTTGNAESKNTVVSVVNETAVGMIFQNLFFTTFGNWNGNFLGWDNFETTTSDLPTLDIEPSPTTDIGSSSAYVRNAIFSSANTGGNSTTGQNIDVHTGNAFSAVSVVNFINSTFFHTLGFFGFINIFGAWDGNIGSAEKFITPSPTPIPKEKQSLPEVRSTIVPTQDNSIQTTKPIAPQENLFLAEDTPSHMPHKTMLGASTNHDNAQGQPYWLLGIITIYIFVNLLGGDNAISFLWQFLKKGQRAQVLQALMGMERL